MSAERRQQVLEATDLMDTPAEPGFDRLTRLAAGLLRAPVALVSLVDERHQFWKSARGLGEPWASCRGTPLSHSFCQHVVHDAAPLVVDDARAHPVLKDNLAIPDLGVIAYAGVPIVVEGEAIGAFCVIDHEPRAWTPEDVGLLNDLAASVVAEIELRMAVRALREQRGLVDAVIDELGDAVLAVDPKRKFLIANAAARRLFPGAMPGRALRDEWAPLHAAARPDGAALRSEDGALARALQGEITNDLVFTLKAPEVDRASWIEAAGRPVVVGGRLVAAVAVYRDVTEKLRAAEAQRAHDEAVEEARHARQVLADEKRHAARVDVLAQISRSLVEAGVNFDGLMRVMADRAAALVGDSALVNLVSDDGRSLEAAATSFPDPAVAKACLAMLRATPARTGEGIAGRVIAGNAGELQSEADPELVARSVRPEWSETVRRMNVHSVLVVPIRLRGVAIGSFSLFRNRPGVGYTAADQVLLQDVADRAALAIDNARLHGTLERRVRERTTALAESQALLHAVLESVPDAIMSVDAAGRITSYNARVAADLRERYGVAVAVGTPLFELGDAPTRAAAREHHRRCMQGESLRFEWSLRDVGRAARHVLVSHSPMTVNGEVFGATVVVTDITARKESELAAIERSRIIELHRQVATTANSSLTSEAALERVLEIVARYGGWSAGHAYAVVDDDLVSRDLWYPAEAPPAGAGGGADRRFVGPSALPRAALRDRRPSWMSLAEPAFAETAPAGVRTGVAFPVFIGKEVVAVLEFFSPRDEAPDPAAVELFENVGRQIGRVIERERHVDQVRTLSLSDELTGLHNRRGFLVLAEQAMKLATRRGAPLLLFFVDLNGMKQINDTLGHEAGDRALVATARLLRGAVRDSDVVARLGGDEFVVLAGEGAASAGSTFAERIKREVEGHNAVPGALHLSLSVGKAVFDPKAPTTIEKLLVDADAAMYEQKAARRRRVALGVKQS